MVGIAKRQVLTTVMELVAELATVGGEGTPASQTPAQPLAKKMA